MENRELLDLIDKSIVGESGIDSELKEKLYEYLIEAYKSMNIHDEDFIITIPGSYTQNFGINHIYRLHEGHLEKTSNEIYAARAYDGIWKAVVGPRTRKSGTVRRTGTRNARKSATAKVSIAKSDDEITELKMMVESLKDSVKKLNKENSIIKELLYSNATSYNDSKTTQTIPIDIYLDTDNSQEIFEVYDSVLRFAKSIGFDESIEFEAVKGSWFKRILAKSQEKLSSDEVQDRLKEAEYGIEVNTILKQQSEIDKNQSEALSNIITSLKDIPNAAIRIGALIVVKLTDEEGSVSLQTRTLSIKELHLLNKKPELLQMPKQILKALANEIDDNIPPQISDN